MTSNTRIRTASVLVIGVNRSFSVRFFGSNAEVLKQALEFCDSCHKAFQAGGFSLKMSAITTRHR
jgi:hypothetical protein